MTDRDHHRINRKLEALIARLPARLARGLGWIHSPWSRFIRLPLGVLLVIFGLFGFLPVLGFWMIPLGLIVLAQDIPHLRRPVLRGHYWIERKIRSWRRRRKPAASGSQPRSQDGA